MSEDFGIEAFASLIDTIVGGYTKCKEIDAQKEAIRANYRIEKRKLDLQKKALEYQYKISMEEVRSAERKYFEELELRRSIIKSHSADKKEFFHLIERCLFEVAFNPQYSKEIRDSALCFCNQASDKIRFIINEDCSKLLDDPYKSINRVLSSQQKEIKE